MTDKQQNQTGKERGLDENKQTAGGQPAWMAAQKTASTGQKPAGGDPVAHSFREIFSSKAHFVATLKQFLKFGFVGIMNTGIALAVYYICVSNGWDKYPANTLGYALGMVNAYLWNAFWVFKGNREGFKSTIPKFFGTYIATYLLSMLLLYLFVDLGGMNEYFAPIVNTCITTFINFFVSKFWTFKK